MLRRSVAALTVATCAAHVAGQTFQRLGTCPTLGCVFPPDRTTFLAGQAFDIRLEVHAPVNGSEAYANGVPDENFVLYIQKDGGEFKDAAKYFKLDESPVERWNFSYYEDLFAEQDDQSTFVEVAAKAYRHIALYEPGNYTAKLQYYNGFETIAHWKVREPSGKRKAKNVIFFVGDGMATSAVTAARLIAHKSINGEYTSLLQLDEMEALGHQMTHSVDSFITDSANSATSLYTGKKASVNALNVYADSSPDPFDDPKFETIAEMAHRINCQKIGIVSTAYIADATPAALTAHTRRRADYPEIIDSFLNGVTANYSWTQFPGVDVLMGGGAENFQPCEDGCSSFKNQDYYQLFAERGYSVVQDKDELDGASTSEKLLGIFSTGNLDKWLDRNVFPENTRGNGNSPKNDGTDADNQPGLKAMTMKAIEVLSNRAKADGDKGFFLMSEAASIDKMHALDYDRALAELLELDDTVRATFAKLKELGELEDTLVVVTADHSHGFDVFGSVDKQYLAQADGDRAKRQAIGVYEQSGLSGYTVPRGVNPKNNTVVIGPQGPGFPVEWDPRYAIAPGFGGNPDRRENYTVHADGPRVPADEIEGLDAATDGNYVNPEDATNGFVVNGTLPVSNSQGVHSLADVSVYASGPGSEYFRGVYDSTGVFFRMADALNLGRTKNVTGGDEKH